MNEVNYISRECAWVSAAGLSYAQAYDIMNEVNYISRECAWVSAAGLSYAQAYDIIIKNDKSYLTDNK